MNRIISLVLALSFLAFMALPAAATSFFFSTGDPDGRIATLSRPASTGKLQTETADDFILPTPFTSITNATFTGLLPAGVPLSSVNRVEVEIYHVFPVDSANPPSGNVVTRVNSPADIEIDSATRDSADGSLSFTGHIISPTFTALNSVVNGIFNKNQNPPNGQFTGGEGSVRGQEVRFDLSFTTPILLPGDHYFFRPEVELTDGNFLWLSAPKPIPAPADLQSWIRNDELAPDWSRIGTDIFGLTPPFVFNAAFSLEGEVVPLPASLPLLGTGLVGLVMWRRLKRSV